MITVYGASDDLIEIDGDITEEFLYTGQGGGDLLAFSDGTVLSILFDDNGMWRIRPVMSGKARLNITHAPATDEERYSDLAYLFNEGADFDFMWVVLGLDIARARR